VRKAVPKAKQRVVHLVVLKAVLSAILRAAMMVDYLGMLLAAQMALWRGAQKVGQLDKMKVG
jgi:hypothetical protein